MATLPTRFGAAISVSDETELGALNASGCTPGTRVRRLDTDTDWVYTIVGVGGVAVANISGARWIEDTGGGGGGTVESVTATTANAINNADAANPIILNASASNAGVMSAADYSKLAAMSGTQTVLARAQSLAGTTIVKTMGTDYDSSAGWRAAGSSGTVTQSTTKTGGVVTLSTTATNGRTALAMPSGNTNLLDNARATRWYLVGRFAITSAIDAQAVCDMRMTAYTIASPQIVFGVLGSVSTAFFSWLIQNDGGTVTASGATTVAVDTAMHVWEMWCDGTTLHFLIDGVEVATTAATNVGVNPCTPAVQVGNGTTATARTMDADYLYLCTPLPPS